MTNGGQHIQKMVLNEQLLQLAAMTHPCTHAEFLPSFSDVAIARTRVRSRSRRYLNPFLHADTVMGMIKSCRCDATVSKVTKTCSFPKLNRALWCLNLPRPWAQRCYIHTSLRIEWKEKFQHHDKSIFTCSSPKQTTFILLFQLNRKSRAEAFLFYVW